MAVGMYVHGKFIEKVRFFKGCKPSFLREVRPRPLVWHAICTHACVRV